MPTPKLTRFTVEGRGKFPWDMLRYDLACPREGGDAYRMEGDEQREVELLTCTTRGPTIERWRSFGWVVTTIDGNLVYDGARRGMGLTTGGA